MNVAVEVTFPVASAIMQILFSMKVEFLSIECLDGQYAKEESWGTQTGSH